MSLCLPPSTPGPAGTWQRGASSQKTKSLGVKTRRPRGPSAPHRNPIRVPRKAELPVTLPLRALGRSMSPPAMGPQILHPGDIPPLGPQVTESLCCPCHHHQTPTTEFNFIAVPPSKPPRAIPRHIRYPSGPVLRQEGSQANLGPLLPGNGTASNSREPESQQPRSPLSLPSPSQRGPGQNP